MKQKCRLHGCRFLSQVENTVEPNSTTEETEIKFKDTKITETGSKTRSQSKR